MGLTRLRFRTSARRLLVSAGIAAVVACLGTKSVSAQGRCTTPVETQFWEIEPDHWKIDGAPSFPEADSMRDEQRHDLGVAFSGGGTRSMAATVGQLRGLSQNGLLEQVRYISAVSGGSWGAVPFTFYSGDLEELLGTFVEPRNLDADRVRREPSGRLAERIVDAGILPFALGEVVDFLPREAARGEVAALQNMLVHWARDSSVLSFIAPAERRRPDKAYARILGGLFLDARGDQPAIVPRGTSAPYTWRRGGARGVTELSRCPTSDFVQSAPNRPFSHRGSGAHRKSTGIHVPAPRACRVYAAIHWYSATVRASRWYLRVAVGI